MKINLKKRVLAFMLCMVMVLSNSASAFAENTNQEQVNTAAETEQQTASEPVAASAQVDSKTETPQTKTTEDTTKEAATVSEEPTVVEEPTVTKDPIASKEPTVVEEPIVTEEPTVTQEPIASEEPVVTEEPKTEETSDETLLFENDDVTITVKAETEGAIPEGTQLQVVPILSDDKETKEQYSQVEEQLNKKAEDEEYSIAGFLAYDITLTDKDGKEIEPSGAVKVSIDYKKEVIPDEVADIDAKDELNVTVMHLEENNAGAVKEVVDMVADETKEAAVETTGNAEVKKAEFVTDSFSVFTVIWSLNGTYRVQLNSHYGYMDANGTFQEFDENVYKGAKLPENWIRNNYNGGEIVLNQYANGIITINGIDYKYTKSKISETDNYSAANTATQISMNNSKGSYYVYYTPGDGGWATLGDALTETGIKEVHVYFTFDVDAELSNITTVDNTTAGITMTMKDLTAEEQRKILGTGGLTSYYGQTFYNVEQNILKPILTDGFPVARTSAEGRALSDTRDENNNVTNLGGGSLKELFDGGTTVNHLFSQDTYDATGYYEYSSFENYAYLGADNNFTVYNQLGTPKDNDPLYYYNRGNFFPYNTITAMQYADNRNLYDEEGNALTSADSRYNERLYKTNGVNTYFSMSLEANFYQPRDGQVHFDNGSEIITSDMIYEFNGDDDLWVFIDGVLVLDIGGIHDAHSGYINYATGAVHVELGTNDSGVRMTSDTTIKAMYERAGVFPDGTSWDDTKVGDYFRDNTFVDYSSHNMKMFYMERGGGASNLHMKFNLQTVPDGQIAVTKNLSGTDKENYANVDFQFELYVQEKAANWSKENPRYTNNYVQVTSANLEDLGIEAAMQGGAAVRWSADGKMFYLKPQQTVNFAGLMANQRYYVKEVGVNAVAYDGVRINSVEVTETSEDGSTITTNETTNLTDVTTATAQVYKRPAVGFTNECSNENLRELRITKAMAEGQSTTDTFAFKIQFTNQSGSLADYALGDYYLIDGEGNYYFADEDGNLISNGTTLIVCGQTSAEGVIEGIPVGYTVIVTQLIAGTEFKVEEVGLDQTIYADPTKEVTASTCGSATVEGADGTILLGTTNAEVTITNEKRSYSIIVKKIDSQLDAEENEITLAGATFTIQEWNASTETYETIMINGEAYAITTGADGLATFADLVPGAYRVIETQTPEGYLDTDPDYRFDIELPYTPNSENPDTTIQVDGQIGDTNQYAVVTKTVENTRQDWEIVKRSSNAEGTPVYLADAEFELSAGNTTYYGKSGSDGTVVWYSEADYTNPVNVSDIPAGAYTLEETNAPAGYARSTTTWTITLGQNGSFISCEGIEDNNMVQSDSGDMMILYFDNVALQSLPNAGGPGVYGYWMFGALLMLAAALYFVSRKRFAK